MLFIYNTTDTKIKIKAKDNGDNNLALTLVIGEEKLEKEVLTINKTDCPKLSETLLKLYGEDVNFAMTTSLVRLNPLLDKSYFYLNPEGGAIEVANNDPEARAKYRNFPRHMLITVTTGKGRTYIDSRNVNGEIKQYHETVDGKDIKLTSFCIRWISWNNLKYPIDILINDEKNVKLSASAITKKSKSDREYFENIMLETEWDCDDKIPEKKPFVKKPYKRDGYKKPYNRDNNRSGGYKKPYNKDGGYKKPYNNDRKPSGDKPRSFKSGSTYGTFNKDNVGATGGYRKKSNGSFKGTKNQHQSKRFDKSYYEK